MVNTLAWTLGTLATRPDIQRAAHDAITSSLASPSHTPDFSPSAPEIPYITALMKESLRHFSTLRLSLPRAAYKDIRYHDLHIPQGTTMLLNVWAANHDESVFGEDVWEFRPERFWEEPELPHASYGFGTRMCAGVHLANRQLYVVLLMLVWGFWIEGGEEEGLRMRPLEVSTAARRRGEESSC